MLIRCRPARGVSREAWLQNPAVAASYPRIKKVVTSRIWEMTGVSFSTRGVEVEVAPERVRAESIDLYVNSLCNLACRTCFLGDEYFHRGHSMSVDDVSRIADWIMRSEVRDVAVLGGEPTLHQDIIEIFQVLRRAGISQTRLITNGCPRARALLAGSLRELVDLPYVSLDGATPETNDVIRGSGSFAHALACIELLHAQGRKFVITSTLGRSAIAELDMLLELAENSGASVLNIHWLSAVGRAKGTTLPVSAPEWERVCERIAEYQPRREGFTVECQLGWRTAPDGPAEKADPCACLVRELANLQFMPDGSVVSCGLLADDLARSGFRWDGERLLERPGDTERSLCAAFGGRGCPVRQSWMGEPDHPLPLCIYQRVLARAA
jgi:MoaA/NifB/PqqE/SkfB family radical SAM enzyme